MKHGLTVAAALAAGWAGWLAPWTAAITAFVVSALIAVLAALWTGARPEVEAFGRDAATVLLAQARLRFRLPPR